MSGRRVVNLSLINDEVAKNFVTSDELRETLQILQKNLPSEMLIVNGATKNVIKIKKVFENDKPTPDKFRVEIKPMDDFFRANIRTKTRAKSARLDLETEIDTAKLVLREVTARGPYGIVYSGTYKTNEVTVKLLDWGEEDTMSRAHLSVLRKYFVEEVNLWNQIYHPNIAKFLGASIANEGYMIPSFRRGKNGEIRVGGNICCLVLENLPGGSIRNFLLQNNKLASKTAIKIASELARGLSYLHSKGIVHCGVNTRNASFDKKGVVKISDIGSAGMICTIETKSNDNNTQDFLPPEVVEGERFTEKSDVYSFGFCLWEIFICNVARTDKHIARAIDSGIPPPIPSSFPQALKGILSLCWKALPSERASMREVVQLLDVLYEDLNKNKSKSLKQLFTQWLTIDEFGSALSLH